MVPRCSLCLSSRRPQVPLTSLSGAITESAFGSFSRDQSLCCLDSASENQYFTDSFLSFSCLWWKSISGQSYLNFCPDPGVWFSVSVFLTFQSNLYISLYWAICCRGCDCALSAAEVVTHVRGHWGSGRECQAVTAQEPPRGTTQVRRPGRRPRGATSRPRPAAAERSYPAFQSGVSAGRSQPTLEARASGRGGATQEGCGWAV